MAYNKKVVKYHSGIHFDIGFIFFLLIIIYVLASIVRYFVSSPVAVYEVQHGTIATNNIYRGIILRDETVEYANKAGFVNYYIKPGAKAAVTDIVCSIDTTGDISKKIDTAVSDGSTVDDSAIGLVLEEMKGFSNSYNPSDYSSVYLFKQSLNSALNQKLSTNALNKLSAEVNTAEANNTFFTMKSVKPGIISYNIDGYEDKSPSNIKSEDFIAGNITTLNLEDVSEVKVLDPIYKRIESDDWQIVIEISDTLAESLKDTSAIKIRFCKDDYTINVNSQVMKRENAYFLRLDLKRAMVRYLDLRYVDIELVLGNESGLKIPNSAIVKKDFWAIPKEYFSYNPETVSNTVLLEGVTKEGSSVKVVTPTIYGESEEAYYVGMDNFDAGDTLRKTDSLDTYMIGRDTVSLSGVYNVNKGYTVFRQINIISENDEYTIVDSKTGYGLSLYDHIALDGSKVDENQIVIN